MGKDPHKSWFLRLGMILVAIAFLTPALGAVLVTSFSTRAFGADQYSFPYCSSKGFLCCTS